MWRGTGSARWRTVTAGMRKADPRQPFPPPGYENTDPLYAPDLATVGVRIFYLSKPGVNKYAAPSWVEQIRTAIPEHRRGRLFVRAVAAALEDASVRDAMLSVVALGDPDGQAFCFYVENQTPVRD